MVATSGALAREYTPLGPTAYEDEHQSEEVKELAGLQSKLVAITSQEARLLQFLEDLDAHWKGRKAPVVEELAELEAVKKKYFARIAELEDTLERQQEEQLEHTGPDALSFVAGSCFSAFGMFVIALNVACMVLKERYPHIERMFSILDQVFLVWYLAELVLRFVYFRGALFIGHPLLVWWNYLDFLIVASGIVDQWIMPALAALGGQKSSLHTSGLRALRLLRLFRVMRILKLLRVALQSDLNWAESSIFESFIMGVIIVNALIMGLELDLEWPYWSTCENLLLSIYFFELFVKVKRLGRTFWYHEEQWMWNVLDFVIVSGGVVDQWMLPTVHFVESEFFGKRSASSGPSGIMTLLRMMRLLRVLRLVRLMKGVKPLYRLLIGVIEALHGMKWVMVMTIVLLYAAAIVFTSLIGHGYLYGGDPPPEASEMFGTVPQSMFVLFKLMNDDQSVVGPIVSIFTGKILFAVFMVISNWAVLAILTSVVSDNMIAASVRSDREDREQEERQNMERNLRRLHVLFAEVDTDGSQCIEEVEFYKMLEDDGLRTELCDASGLSVDDLEDLFHCLSEDKNGVQVMGFKDFVDALNDEGKSADKRSVLHVMKYLQAMESRLEKRINSAMSSLGVNVEQAHYLAANPSYAKWRERKKILNAAHVSL